MHEGIVDCLHRPHGDGGGGGGGGKKELVEALVFDETIQSMWT